MKTILFTLTTLAALSATATSSLHPDTMKAIECRPAATQLAKMAMDQKAKAYLFESADVEEASFVKSFQGKNEKTYVFHSNAYIYKGSYRVYVELDSSCGAVMISIKENL